MLILPFLSTATICINISLLCHSFFSSFPVHPHLYHVYHLWPYLFNTIRYPTQLSFRIHTTFPSSSFPYPRSSFHTFISSILPHPRPSLNHYLLQDYTTPSTTFPSSIFLRLLPSPYPSFPILNLSLIQTSPASTFSLSTLLHPPPSFIHPSLSLTFPLSTIPLLHPPPFLRPPFHPANSPICVLVSSLLTTYFPVSSTSFPLYSFSRFHSLSPPHSVRAVFPLLPLPHPFLYLLRVGRRKGEWRSSQSYPRPYHGPVPQRPFAAKKSFPRRSSNRTS